MDADTQTTSPYTADRNTAYLLKSTFFKHDHIVNERTFVLIRPHILTFNNRSVCHVYIIENDYGATGVLPVIIIIIIILEHRKSFLRSC